MATILEEATLATLIYGKNKIGPPPGWIQLPFTGENPTTGFAAAAYQNLATGEITIAYRGTDDFVKDFLDADLKIIAGNLPDRQYEDALTFFNTVRQQYPDAPISLTGHSLGGTLSELVSITIFRESGATIPAVTFEAPGTQGILSGVPASDFSYIVNFEHPSEPAGGFRKHYGVIQYFGGVPGPGIGEAPWWLKLLPI